MKVFKKGEESFNQKDIVIEFIEEEKTVVVTGISGVETEEQLEKRLTHDQYAEYDSGDKIYFREDNNDIWQNSGRLYDITVGERYTKEKFFATLGHIEKCCKRLHKIIQESKPSVERVAVI